MSIVTISTDHDGYRYIAVTDSFADTCSNLPCWAGIHWPGYATKVIEATINDKPVVIQLWRVHCQRAFSSDKFPGGYGAEVGIYHRDLARTILAESLTLNPFYTSVAGVLPLPTLGTPLWWPSPELKTSLTFELINPETKLPFFSAGPKTSYWLTKWMHPDSYAVYSTKNKVPSWSDAYEMRCTVNGKSYSWE